MEFNNLHRNDIPLLICNVWDVASAQIANKLGFKAIGTSSGAIADMLGYEDGEQITFNELEYIVKRIRSSCNLPLSVDLEAGYSRNLAEIIDNIIRLSKLGVVGINIEDSLVKEERVITDSDIFASLLDQITTGLKKHRIDMFINVRTDTFLLGLDNPVHETLVRASKYRLAGADGIFVPCIEKIQDLEIISREIELPLNIMSMPNLPDFNILQNLGIKRLSMGNFAYSKMLRNLELELSTLQKNQSFKSLFA